MNLDIIFVHAPNLSNFYLPIGRFVNNNYVPMGTIALANLAKKNGYQTSLLHMGVERILDKDFSIVEYVNEHKVKIVAFDLFWFHQSYDVIDIARKIKESLPETFICLGGLTASYYDREIMQNFDFIDAVMSGYGENAVLEICDFVVHNKGELELIPNLVFRKEQEIIKNNKRAIQRELIQSLDYSSLEVMEHYQTYVDYFGLHEMPLDWSDSRKKILNETIVTKMFPLAIGRGCDTMCTYCGGNRKTCESLYGKDFMVWRNPETVIADIEKVKNYGYDKVYICYDPVDSNHNYYVNLFNEIAEKEIQISMYFECWKLPDKDFLDAFKKAFPDKNSHLLLSIDSVSTLTRGLNRSNVFDNQQMHDLFMYCDEIGVRIDLCFSLALPGSNFEEDMKTYEFMRNILHNYKVLGRVNTFLIDLVPGSPIYENAEKLNSRVSMHCFMDYYHSFEKPFHSTYALCNYKIENYFGDARDEGDIYQFSRELQNMKCQYFCGINEEDVDNAEECRSNRQCIYDKYGINVKAKPFDGNYTYQDELEIVMKKMNSNREVYK